MAKNENINSLSEEERREKLRQGLLRKKKCETKALSLVEQFISEKVDRESFREAANYLNENYYQDIIEERNCVKMCGYALCSSVLNNVPKQQYHISATQKKVFDITERKKFCSNNCFKGSNFYRDQLKSSPLWLRENSDIIVMKFYDEVSRPSPHVGQGYGVEVIFQFKDTNSGIESCNAQVEKSPSTKVVFNVDENMKDITSAVDTPNYDDVNPSVNKVIDIDKTVADHGEMLSKVHETKTFGILKNSPKDHLKIENKIINTECNSKNSTPDPTVPIQGDKKLLKKCNGSNKKGVKEIPSLVKVDKSITEWYTIDSLRLIKGDDFVRQVLRENKCTVSSVVAAIGISSEENTMNLQRDVKEKYVQLCRRLELQDLEDEQWDRNVLKLSQADRKIDSTDDLLRTTEKRPMPSYDALREISETELLKVGSYLKGKTEFEIADKNNLKKNKDLGSEEDECNSVSTLPLLDRNAQGALRRRIFHDQIDRLLPDMLQLVGISKTDIAENLRKLVLSFELTASNVVLQTKDWTLVCLYLIKMLSLMDVDIATAMDSASSKKYISLLLLGYGTDIKHLEAKINQFHTDIHHLITKLKATPVMK